MIGGRRQGADQAPSGAMSAWRRFRALVRQYLWLWIAYQTVKGSLTVGLVWLPLWWAYRG